MAIVGRADIILRAIGDQLENDIKKSLNKAGIDGGRSGGSAAGKALSENTANEVRKNIDKTSIAIENGLDGVGERVGKEIGKDIVENAREEVEKGAPDIGEELGKSIGDRAGRSFERSRFFRSLASSAVKLGVLIPVVGVIVGGLSSLVSGLFAVSAALGTALASSISLVGALGALVQGVGVAAIAFIGLGDAISAGFDPEKVEEYNKALEKLTPEARSFVEQLVGMKDEFILIRNAAQAGFFPGLTESLTKIEPLLPRLAERFKETGEAMGRVVSRLTDNFTSDTFLDNLGDLADSNNKVIQMLGESVGNLGRSLIGLLDAASPLTERMSKAFANWTENLQDSIEAANDSGKLSDYFMEAGDAMALVGDVLGSFLEGMYELGQIAQPTGIKLLEAFRDANQELANLTEDAEKVKNIEDYFDGIYDNVMAISGLVKDLGKAFIDMGDDPAIAKTADALREIVPDLQEALEVSLELGPAIAEFIGELLNLYTALAESGAIQTFVDVLSSVVSALNSLLRIKGVGETVGVILSLVAALKALQIVSRIGMFAAGGVTSLLGNIRNVGTRARFMAADLTGGTIALNNFDRAARNASRGSQTLSQRFSSFGRIGGSVAGVAALGVTAATAGKEFEYSNTAWGTMIGSMILPGVGTALGAAAGYVADVASGFGRLSNTSKDFYSSIGTGDLEALNADLTIAKDKLESFSDPSFMDKVAGGWKVLLSFGGWDPDDGHAEAQDAYDSIQQEIDTVSERIQREMDRQTLQVAMDLDIQFDQITGNLEGFKTELSNVGKSFNLTGSDGVLETRQYFSTLGSTVSQIKDTLGSSSREFKDAKQQIVDFAQQAGLSAIDAEYFASAITGTTAALTDLPKGTEIEMTLETQALLESLGVSRDAINDLKRDAQTGWEFGAQAGNPLKQLTERTDAKIQELKDKFRNADITMPIDGDDTAISEKERRIKERIRQTKEKMRIDADPFAAEFVVSGLANKIRQRRNVPVGADTSSATSAINAWRPPRKRIPATAAIDGYSVGKGIRAYINATAVVGGMVKRASGGWISGPGSGTSDSIPAMLSNGEYVVRAVQAARYGPLLEAINEGRALPSVPVPASGATASTSSSSNHARIVSGTLSIDASGRAFISGVAEDVYDNNKSFENAQG